MKKLILFITLLFPIALFAQQGGVRSINTKSEKIVHTDLSGGNDSILIRIDAEGKEHVLTLDNETIYIENDTLKVADGLETDQISGAIIGAIASDGSANFSQASSSDLSDSSNLAKLEIDNRFAGNQSIEKSSPELVLNGTGTTQRGQIRFQRDGVGDFNMGVGAGNGSNDFNIYNYSGNIPLTINKGTNITSFIGVNSTGGYQLNGTDLFGGITGTTNFPYWTGVNFANSNNWKNNNGMMISGAALSSISVGSADNPNHRIRNTQTSEYLVRGELQFESGTGGVGAVIAGRYTSWASPNIGGLGMDLMFYTKPAGEALSERFQITTEGDVNVITGSYQIGGTSLLQDHLKSGSAGVSGQYLKSNGSTSAPTWATANWDNYTDWDLYTNGSYTDAITSGENVNFTGTGGIVITGSSTGVNIDGSSISGGSGYLPLSGGTLTGNLVGTNATFSGVVTATNVGLSDKRLKSNIRSVNANLSKVPLIQFTFKNDTTERVRYGVIAQELQKVAPEMVYEGDNGYLRVAYTDFLIARLHANEIIIKTQQYEIYLLFILFFCFGFFVWTKRT